MNLLKPQQDSEPEEALETAMAMVASALSDSSRVSILCALMDGAHGRQPNSVRSPRCPPPPPAAILPGCSATDWWCVSRRGATAITAAGSHIAGLLENLMGVSMQAHKTLLPSTPVNLRYARTCYDHLAGELAVNIYEFMLRENGWRQMAP